MTKPTTPQCPYVGLRSFSEAEQAYFFGREREARIISANISASRLTILYGASGVGKSSILRAAVLPNLRAAVLPNLRSRPRTAIVMFREWQRLDFLAALKAECLKAIPSETVDKSALRPDIPLGDLLRQAATASNWSFVVLFDQFEEYFVYRPDVLPDDSFESEFARCVNNENIDASFLISIREEGLAKMDRFRTRIPNLLSNTIRLHHLDVSAAETAIRGPLKVFNAQMSGGREPVTIEDKLVEEVLDQVRIGKVTLSQTTGVGVGQRQEDSSRIETSYLQLVMKHLWEEEARASSAVLRAATLQRLGGAKKIVSSYLDDIMRTMKPLEMRACSRFFDHLVTPSGNKIAYTPEDLTAFAGKLAPYVPTVLQKLSEAIILHGVTGSSGGEAVTQYEISHDVLAPAVLDWNVRYVGRRKKLKKSFILGSVLLAVLILFFVGRVAILRNLAKGAELQAAQDEREGYYDRAVLSLEQAKKDYQLGFDVFGAERASNSLTKLYERMPWGYMTNLLTGFVYTLTGERVNIGRNALGNEVVNEISSTNILVSRRHLVLTRNCVIEDLRSRNGSTVNGKTLYYGFGVKITDGDVAVLAGVEAFRFSTKKPEDSTIVPLEAWGVFVNNTPREFKYLIDKNYSVVMNAGGLSLISGRATDPLARIRADADTAVLDVNDEWYLVLTHKSTDYEYEYFTFNSNVWVRAFGASLMYAKFKEGKKEMEGQPLPFQMILIKKSQ